MVTAAFSLLNVTDSYFFPKLEVGKNVSDEGEVKNSISSERYPEWRLRRRGSSFFHTAFMQRHYI